MADQEDITCAIKEVFCFAIEPTGRKINRKLNIIIERFSFQLFINR